MSPSRALSLLSIVPALEGEKGHIFGYQQAFGRAAALNGWSHAVAVARGHGLAELPAGWRACLPEPLDAGLLHLLRQGRWGTLWRGVTGFAKAVEAAVQNQLESAPRDCAVFLESFNWWQLLALHHALGRVDRSRLNLWLLYREDPALIGAAGKLYVWGTKRLARLFGPAQFSLLTDSEPLREALSHVFEFPAHVMPIPHTSLPAGPRHPKSADELVCWWPGSARREKGLDVIHSLVHSGETWEGDGKRIRLVVSRAAAESCANRPLIVHAVDDVLSAEEYDRWMRTTDIVLLPYVAKKYRASTSGIFAECVAAGKLPMVSASTWMANELRKHGLDDLVIDWTRPDILSHLSALGRDERLWKRLAGMRESFVRFHDEPSFACELLKVGRTAGA